MRNPAGILTAKTITEPVNSSAIPSPANIVNFIYDNDFIDSPINDQDFKPAVNNQA